MADLQSINIQHGWNRAWWIMVDPKALPSTIRIIWDLRITNDKAWVFSLWRLDENFGETLGLPRFLSSISNDGDFPVDKNPPLLGTTIYGTPHIVANSKTPLTSVVCFPHKLTRPWGPPCGAHPVWTQQSNLVRETQHMRRLGHSWNRGIPGVWYSGFLKIGVPPKHPFLWDFPVWTLHFGVPPLLETSIWFDDLDT